MSEERSFVIDHVIGRTNTNNILKKMIDRIESVIEKLEKILAENPKM